jgi:hypothetical protein
MCIGGEDSSQLPAPLTLPALHVFRQSTAEVHFIAVGVGSCLLNYYSLV